MAPMDANNSQPVSMFAPKVKTKFRAVSKQSLTYEGSKPQARDGSGLSRRKTSGGAPNSLKISKSALVGSTSVASFTKSRPTVNGTSSTPSDIISPPVTFKRPPSAASSAGNLVMHSSAIAATSDKSKESILQIESHESSNSFEKEAVNAVVNASVSQSGEIMDVLPELPHAMSLRGNKTKKPIFRDLQSLQTVIDGDEEDGGKSTVGSPKPIMQLTYTPTPEPRDIRMIWMDIVFRIFLLPAFDSKGRSVVLDNVERGEVTFKANGLHPRSIFNALWDLTTNVLFLAVFCLVPLYIAFDEFSGLNLFSLCVTGLFFIDTVITIITPQPESSTIICSFREYEALRPTLTKWVAKWVGIHGLLEILPIIPLEFIFSSIQYSHLFLLLRLVRLARLPQISSRCSFLNRWKFQIDEVFGFGISKIIPILIAMLGFLHYNACTMYYLGRLTGFIEWGVLWPEIETAHMFEFYCWTFYQSVGAMFPLSFMPQTPIEQLFASVYVISAATLYGAFLGAISSATMSINPSGKMYQQKMEQLSDYVKFKNLTAETEDKLFSYYETKYRGKFFEEEMLLSEMNESLRAEICLQNTRDLIERVPFLRRKAGDGRDEIFLGRIATALKQQYYVAGDFITKQGDSGQDMFFILSGRVDVFVNGTKVVSLYDKTYIGEVALIAKTLRTATVQSAIPSVLYRLTYADFHQVLDEFLDMKIMIAALAQERTKLMENLTVKD
ncbi:hypothetical protein BDR26DRAFT_143070 [Obelidium mucronatum]|nr:hypothetical protein BDR26DRAFT_143070 [Obelidium mucronatum]